MSDGPHRSLSLGRRWKKLAECLDNGSFTVEEVCERRDAAIMGEFQREVADSLASSLRRALCGSEQGSLFGSPSDDIEALRPITSGAVGSLLIDCVVDAIESGLTGEAALLNGYQNAACEVYDRHARGMSEHYQRNTTSQRASHFQARIDATRDSDGISGIARHLAVGSRGAMSRPASKRSGLDEGVRLS